MSGTDSAISLRAGYAMSGASVPYIAICVLLSGTDILSGAIFLFFCYVIPNTDIAHGAFCLGLYYAVSGTDLARFVPGCKRLCRCLDSHHGDHTDMHKHFYHHCGATGTLLRACYAMSSSDIGYASVCTRLAHPCKTKCSAPGTLAAYALATRCPVLPSRLLQSVISSIDLAYGASSLRAPYAMSGTDLAHGARVPSAVFDPVR
eukprot:1586608-Rhodomonas_salina.2